MTVGGVLVPESENRKEADLLRAERKEDPAGGRTSCLLYCCYRYSESTDSHLLSKEKLMLLKDLSVFLQFFPLFENLKLAFKCQKVGVANDAHSIEFL